ncbi:MAG TPA: Gfo/Idh/MocA family oxidoreductase [Edaphobacter sp.]|nr:Gfo/Idh/MocA family oxidoreductase [Edaphobacter sp.]
MKDKTKTTVSSRRTFLKTSLGAAAAAGFPTIVPSSVFGQLSPSNRINVGAIGVGRISRGHDLPGIWKYDQANVMAVCDLDANRVELGKALINGYYSKKTGKPYDGVIGYHHYRELLANKDIDAVVISTPDHQHAILAVDAVRAKKDVYLQKPASLTISEGRHMSDQVTASKQILQIGSQQRSWKQFYRACELVRNGRIGEIKHVEIGLPGDPAGGDPTPMPVPTGFQYDEWLGSTPEIPYTVDRVMPVKDFSRPGWLRMEQFGAGMITGWGAHHVDTAHWGMNTELTGPVEIWGTAEFPTSGLWDVHGKFLTHARYANGVTMDISGDFPNGIKWYGTKGWIFVTRDEMTTPTSTAGQTAKIEPLMASDPKILDSVIGPNDVHLYQSDDQHGNWLDCIKSRKAPTAPAEIGHRACSTCLLHHIAMKTKRHLHWDPAKERFLNDDAANAMLSRPQRAPYVMSV